MSKQFNPSKPTVELDAPPRGSRIRRDPTHVKQDDQLARTAWWETREWEIRLAIIGVILFALGINALVVDFGELLSH
jgi:hypothetical protein